MMRKSMTGAPLRLLLAGLVFLAALPALNAAAPFARTPAPGFYRMSLGRFEVTALHDGRFSGSIALLRGIGAAEAGDQLARFFINPSQVPLDCNAFLVNTGAKLLLVDAGTGPGSAPANLRAASYAPEQVDAVFVTHMHGDHIGGLLDADGKPAYVNATLYVAKAEADFWLSAETAAKAPAERQRTFKSAQAVASAYQALNRLTVFGGDGPGLPGVRAVSIPGHTPGHTAYEVGSDGQTLLIWGDLVHVMAVQLARPQTTLTFDFDPPQAATTRGELFRRAAAGKLLVAGMHMPFPGIGRLRAEGDGYAWVPVAFMQ